MPASFTDPPPNSLASLSLEAESQLGFSGQASSNVSSVEACSTSRHRKSHSALHHSGGAGASSWRLRGQGRRTGWKEKEESV